jgi:hypothetical protein
MVQMIATKFWQGNSVSTSFQVSSFGLHLTFKLIVPQEATAMHRPLQFARNLQEPTTISRSERFSSAVPYTLDTPGIQGKEKRDHAQ